LTLWYLALDVPVTSIDPPLVKPLTRRTRSVWVTRVMLFATVIVLVDALVGEHDLVASLRARHDYMQEQARIARLRAKNADLREQVRRLTSDAETIEALARTELGLIRPGEVLFIVKPAPASPGSPRPRR